MKKTLIMLSLMFSSIFTFSQLTACSDSNEPQKEEKPSLPDISENYKPAHPEDIKDDIQVKVTGGKASSVQPGTGIESSFDGDYQTIYHSKWDNASEDYFPITLDYYFAKGSDMDYLIYYPRPTGRNGLFRQVEIFIKSNADGGAEAKWKKVMDFDFGGSTSPTRVEFPQSLIGVSAVRFVVKSGAGDRQGFVSCAEMEFYKKNPDSFDYASLFTDATCSELKPGVTLDNISDCTSPFFRNIAFYLYHDRYEKEFRINTFKAYPHPMVQGKENKTSAYSLMDNPTGIAVEKGELLVVLANKLPQTKITLRVQNLDVPEGDGAEDPTDYPLASGVNKLKMQTKGLVYILYHSPEYETLPPLKLHFATGTVNGYFDSQLPTHQGRAKELLDGATNAYFDVLGKYAHLTFPTKRFRNHTTDLVKLIEAYDAIVYNEQELLGLVKYNLMFKNRMYFNVMYTSYMYATQYRTAYNDKTLNALCDEMKLTTSSCWGPAHEVGHCNQTRPGLKWLGTTEVTNNIMSEYIQTTIFGQPSRVQTEDMHNPVSRNRYSKAWNAILVGQTSHASEGDVFCKLIPFWQLELYFGKVLGRTPKKQSDKGGFYPDVYQYLRTHEDAPTDGLLQLEFVYIASKMAKMNLLDFFEKWGFLRPLDMELDDYGRGTMTVKQKDADDVRRRVKELGYEKPSIPLEYITDNNVQVLLDKQAIVAGTAERKGNTLLMKNWQYVMVYEVRDKDENGPLICVSDGILTPSSVATFDVKDGWKSSYKVFAVAHDNKRVLVPMQ